MICRGFTMSESKVFLFDDKDPEMQKAYERARETFRYFWREVSWEKQRIVPGLDLAAVKAPFGDDVQESDQRDAKKSDHPDVEQMWVSQIDFNGDVIDGVLLNSPNWIKSFQEGDPVSLALDEITDWMYVIGGQVYGAYTVNLIRSRMSARERKEHDAAWGLDFGDPHKIRVVPQEKSGGFLKGLFGGNKEPPIGEHPMSENMAPEYRKQLQQDPSSAKFADERGWTLLHQHALAGNLAPVTVLIEFGADVNARTSDGATPLQLARILGWDKVIAMLQSHGAK